MSKNPKSYFKTRILPNKILRYVVFTLLVILSLIPFLFLFNNTTRLSDDIRSGVSLIPGNYLKHNWDNFVAKQNGMTVTLWRCMINSLMISIPSTLLTVYFSALTAYGIHVYNFKFKKFAWGFILAVMLVPTQVSIIGYMRFMMKINLDDTYWPLILPGIAAPMVVFFIKQYLESTLPLEIVEAARVDGTGEFRIFNTIAMPLMLPAIATQAIFSFVASWNNLFTPSMLITSDQKKTLTMFVQLLLSDQFKADFGIINVAVAITILPIFIIYFLLSKYIVDGVALGGVKE